MKLFFKHLLFMNWQRKLLGLLLAVIVWILVNHSISMTKTFYDVPIKVIHLPAGKTIEGLGPDNILDRHLTLHITGSKKILEDLTSNDFEVLVNAAHKKDEWIVTVRKNELMPLNPAINLLSNITTVTHESFPIKLSNIISEDIPVFVTQPIGTPPDGYRFLDIWPKKFYMEVQGPEQEVKALKWRGLKLTFNLNEISEQQLHKLFHHQKNYLQDEVSFFIPDNWKQTHFSFLKKENIEITSSKNTHNLRIDFIKNQLTPLNTFIPLTVYYPLNMSQNLNPQAASLQAPDLLKEINGILVLNLPLYAFDVSDEFLDIVKDYLQIVITAKPSNQDRLPWYIEFINPHSLENQYVAKKIMDSSDATLRSLSPALKEEYLRDRFHQYMSSFQFYLDEKTSLNLIAEMHGNNIVLQLEAQT